MDLALATFQTCQPWENFLSTTMVAPFADSHFFAGGEQSARAVRLVRGAGAVADD